MLQARYRFNKHDGQLKNMLEGFTKEDLNHLLSVIAGVVKNPEARIERQGIPYVFASVKRIPKNHFVTECFSQLQIIRDNDSEGCWISGIHNLDWISLSFKSYLVEKYTHQFVPR